MAIPRPVDPYRVLGVRADASLAEVKDAHRRLAKRFHPDAAGGDAERFLAVQDAYQVLADPLRRKEWDLHHAPGPVRAGQRAGQRGSQRPAPRGAQRGEQAAARDRARPGRPTGRGTGQAADQTAGQPADQATGQRSGRRASSGRADPYADSYTWSAQGVPWWEQDAPPGSGRRQPGRQRPRTGRSGQPDEAPEAKPDFEVFNRSSGAAWSSAARAHFRRSTSDLPRGAAEPYATRWTTPDSASRTRSAPPPPDADMAMGTATHRPSSAHGPSSAPRPTSAPRASSAERPFSAPRASSAQRPFSAPRATSAPRPPFAQGTTFRRPPTGARSFAGRSTTPWPALPARFLLCGLAWVPLALLVAFGGGAVSGCADASVACPAAVPPVQAAVLVLLAVALFAFPRVAYLAAGAGVGMLVAGLVVAAISAFGDLLTGVVAPRSAVASAAGFGAPTAMAFVVVAVLIGAYLLAGWIVWRDRPVRRPWLGRPGASPWFGR